MTNEEKFKKELYAAFKKAFLEMGSEAKNMSWFWRSHFRLKKIGAQL